jgi:L-threonylcarbamoyladenylate synthase
MKTLVVPAESAADLERALIVLNAGGLVAFPTDTVYGLGALAFDDEAVKSIYRAKGRPLEKAIPVLLADSADLDLVASFVPEMARRLSQRFWPGPLTLVVPKIQGLPNSVSDSHTVAARVPDLALARTLLRAAGPMAVTSANMSGQPSPTSAEEVLQELNGRIPLILDGGTTSGGIPSTVVDCTGAEPVILRSGPLLLADIQRGLIQLQSSSPPRHRLP